MNKYEIRAHDAFHAYADKLWLNQTVKAKAHLQKVCAHPDCQITFHHRGDYCCVDHHNECESKR